MAWTVSPAYSTGQFRVGLLNAAGTMVLSKTLAPTAAKTSYTLALAASVPAGTYKAFVYYTPTAGSTTYTVKATGAAFKVTP